MQTRFCIGQSCHHTYVQMDTICRAEMIASLFRISKVVIETESLPETLSILLKIMKEDMGVVKGIVCLFNSRTGKIFIHDSIGLTKEEETRGVYSIGEGIIGKVVETGQKIVVPRISQEPNFLNRTKSLSNQKDAELSFVCIPILHGKKVLGAISVVRVCGTPDALNYDVELLGIIAAMIAQAVELYLLENEDKGLLRIENERLRDALKERFHPSNIIGNSKPMLEVYALINKIAKTKSTVLILGESGVGKERVASAIHYNSPDANKPFIKFNCAALPESVIESELFGHEKGAYTGADKIRKGRFEEADGGTIFLDEVGELSLPMQAKLLRVLQERIFERVGGNKPIKVNIRIIAATNRDLAKMAKDGQFRQDLYYRLNVFPIVIPPLRERSSDILTLAEYFVSHFVKKFNKEIKSISVPVQEMLLAYSWPGNVRELENVIERAVILTEDNIIHSCNLPLSLQAPVLATASFKKGLLAKLDSIEYDMIVEALLSCKGNISKAAQKLGMTRRALSLRMQKFGINYKKYRLK
ncbi:transcriptional regulator, NifA subfamily, Fis Family [Chloroherpeton thalassium ATCC 35110]|uniref:Transcriptional regulator, NifA subfamily, Fis Family n=1 Tax=Chloroherpeton thalassium (strain ATCC 35110 / GB-78) TaxID=517418 RepID=B3QTU6_CHLT3|nr:sigma 54-interacting transcriptional regulator [Chloroherpeton thalassium]ACF14294.1 transcriptional regulator, NifA subfamily, Fis Family [Chloroherpeton thalassium ATCC 35110]